MDSWEKIGDVNKQVDAVSIYATNLVQCVFVHGEINDIAQKRYLLNWLEEFDAFQLKEKDKDGEEIDDPEFVLFKMMVENYVFRIIYNFEVENQRIISN